MLEGQIQQQNVAGQQIGTIEGGSRANNANGLMTPTPSAGNGEDESFVYNPTMKKPILKANTPFESPKYPLKSGHSNF